MAFPTHFDGRRFYNPGGSPPHGIAAVFKWVRTRQREASPRSVPIQPSVPPGRVAAGILATVVNHSTVLVQQAGSNILTDPIWSEHAGPWGKLGPRRHRAPGVEFDKLPPIDTVLLSHNHYDHLDLPTLRRLQARGASRFVTPVGVARFLEAHGIRPAHELDWGDSLAVTGGTIHSVPAIHFSGRRLFDRNRTLWCGYLMESTSGRVYFAADTGFGPHFGWIRERLGRPDLALLPIGAYRPRWFMSPVHMNPEEAVEAHGILGAPISIAIHHGTFQLADESTERARQRLREIAPENFLSPENGEPVLVTDPSRV